MANDDLEGYDLIRRAKKTENDDTEDDIWIATVYEMAEFADWFIKMVESDVTEFPELPVKNKS